MCCTGANRCALTESLCRHAPLQTNLERTSTRALTAARNHATYGVQVCQRLLPYKEDTAEMLLHSLKLVIGLSGGVAWELAERIATEVSARGVPLICCSVAQ